MSREFNAASLNYLEAINSPHNGTPPLSMSVWLKPPALAGGTAFSLGHGSSGSNHYIAIGMLAAGTGFLEARGASVSTLPGNALTLNQWNHLGGVVLATNSRRVYVNGGMDASSADIGAFSSPLNRITVGAIFSNGARISYRSGIIALPAIWNIALTDAEMLDLSAGVHPLEIQRDALIWYREIGFGSPERVGFGSPPLAVIGAALSADEPVVNAAPADDTYESLITSHESLIRYWKLGEPTGFSIDMVNGIGLTYTGSPIRDVAGALGEYDDGAVNFNGASIAQESPASWVADTLSFECWVKVAAGSYNSVDDDLLWETGSAPWFGSAGTTIADLNNSSEAGTISFGFRDNTASSVRVVFPQSALPADGDFHHLVVIYDCTQDDNGGDPIGFDRVIMYVDGERIVGQSVPESGIAVLNNINMDSESIRIGARGTSLLNSSTTVDEFAIYNDALTPVEILAHYDAGIGTIALPADLNVDAPAWQVSVDIPLPEIDGITVPELGSFPSNTTLIDDFNRANGNVRLGGGAGIWDINHAQGNAGLLTISSERLTGGSSNGQLLLGDFGPNIDIIIDISTINMPGYLAIFFGIQNAGASNWEGYFLLADGSNWYFRKRVAGAITDISASAYVGGQNAGESIGLRRIDNVMEAYHKNTSGVWTLVGSEVDSTFLTSGRIALETGSGGPFFDNLRGGTLLGAPVDLDLHVNAPVWNIPIQLPELSIAKTIEPDPWDVTVQFPLADTNLEIPLNLNVIVPAWSVPLGWPVPTIRTGDDVHVAVPVWSIGVLFLRPNIPGIEFQIPDFIYPLALLLDSPMRRTLLLSSPDNRRLALDDTTKALQLDDTKKNLELTDTTTKLVLTEYESEEG